MFRRNREKRYHELIKAGFRPFEGKWLSTIPFSHHPAMAHLIRKRRKLQERRIKEANRKGWSQAKRELVWNKRTKVLYQRATLDLFNRSSDPSRPGGGRAESIRALQILRTK